MCPMRMTVSRSSPFPVARIDLVGASVTLVQSSGGKVAERLSLQGLGLALDAASLSGVPVVQLLGPTDPVHNEPAPASPN